jgi:Tfp pilus assembly protein PilX
MKYRTQFRPFSLQHQRGFALVVTLSLMILLTVIAVGLLSLSSISLRSSAQGNAMATAQANARLALMLAIGDLQKYAGPDQRITARADVLDRNPANRFKNPRLTGVWKSTEFIPGNLPTEADYQKTDRDAKFLGWMTSSLDNKASQMDYAKDTTLTTTGSPAPAVALWDKGSLGSAVAENDIVIANKIPTSPSRGAVAWAVMDEGVKVRVNTPYVDEATTKAMQSSQLGSGERPNTASLAGLSDLKRPIFEYGKTGFGMIEKGISRQNLELAATNLVNKATADALKPLTHDVTSGSAGVFTDTASGGLKEDLSLIINGSALPASYADKGVYKSRLGVTAPSDPTWESLWQFARIYKDTTRLTTSGGVPVLKAQGPAGWRASAGSDPNSATSGTIQPAPPKGVVLMPTVAKVQLVFSLLTRDIYNYPRPAGSNPDTTPKTPGTKAQEEAVGLHGPWGKNFAGSSYDYLLHLLYTPVVTLHNPYNVALEFNEMKVIFGNVPFALQVFRNGVAQTNGPAPLDTMYFQASETGNRSKRFGMTLKTSGGSASNPIPGVSTFRLLPGEVMLFSPYIDPNRTWKDEYSNRQFSDWDSGSTNNGGIRTLSIDGMPGWRGDGIGFDLDWFCPSYKGLRVTSNETENGVNMHRGGCIGVRAIDEFSLKFAPLSVDALSKNKFTVEIFAKPTLSSPLVSSGMIELDYEKPTGLQESLLGANGTITYPKSGTINAMAMHSHSLTKIKDIATAKPFAIISAQAKTTFGGLNPDGEDGKLATKPWCFAHAVVATASQKLSQHPANHSHEISLQRLDNGTNNLLQFDPKTGRGNFITGQTGNTGLKFGSQYDIPLAPLQTLASLNGANPGGSSGYLPRFAQPIGNSWAHPLISPDKILQSGSSGYDYIDHSYLLNLALYDRFYFSGLADQTGPFGSAGRTTSLIVGEFIDGKPLVDPRLVFHTPQGRLSSELTAEVTSADAHAKIASWQLMNGAFNINSTSVAAWKAMLGSIHDSQAIVNKLDKTNKNSTFSNLTATSMGSSRISRFRLPVESDLPEETYWLGAREYTDAELQLLAEKIVEQVRQRGPFLSLSDFVNRRIGTGETAQRGALQQAIDNADLNKSFGTGLGAGFDIPAATVSGYKYGNASAGTGSSFQGAPGFLTQADLLGVLGNAATPRSDTFTIRGYGESRDAANKVVAFATCEAIIQRMPEYIDPSDKPEIAPVALTSRSNKTFGRRFNVVSFRWLSEIEI